MTAPAKKDRPLKFWSISESGRADAHFYVAAPTLADACVLLAHAEGIKEPYNNPFSASHLTTYGSSRWGTTATALLEAKRGVWKVTGGSIEWKDQKGVRKTFIEPPGPVSTTVPDPMPSEAAALQPIPEGYGKITSGITKQMKVDEWTFESPHHNAPARFRATIYLIRGGRRFHGRLVDRDTAFTFTAESDQFEPIEDTDIDRLRVKVSEAFQTYDLGQRGIVWEDWLEVEINPEGSSHWEKSVGGGLKLTYRRLKRGVHPRTQKVLTIHESNGVVTSFPEPKSAKPPKKGEDEDDDDFGVDHDDRDRRDRSHQYAYIPATVENVAALNGIIAALGSARLRLEALLSQKEIAKTLANLPTVPLLEAKS